MRRSSSGPSGSVAGIGGMEAESHYRPSGFVTEPRSVPLPSVPRPLTDGGTARRFKDGATQSERGRNGMMSRILQYGGIAASVVLIAFGVGSIVTGIDGRDRVRDDLKREQIVGTPDST